MKSPNEARGPMTRRAAAIISLLMKLTDTKEHQVITHTGITAINAKKRAKTVINLDDIDAIFSMFPGTPELTLAHLTMTEQEFLQWVAENRPDLVRLGSSCFTPEWVFQPTLWDEPAELDLRDFGEPAVIDTDKSEPFGLLAGAA